MELEYHQWGAKTRTFMLGPKPHLLTRIRPRSRKCLEGPHSMWSCREMFEGTSLRGLSSSDLTNVSQVNFGLTWVTFQEGPVTKIDFRCARKGQEHRNILGKTATTVLNALQYKVKNQLSRIANSSKTYSSDIYSILDYVSFPPWTSFKP